MYNHIATAQMSGHSWGRGMEYAMFNNISVISPV